MFGIVLVGWYMMGLIKEKRLVLWGEMELYTKHKDRKESESEVAQSCPTLCNPMDCSLPGSSVHGILQARVREWVAISFSRRSSQPGDRTRVSCIAGRRFKFVCVCVCVCVCWGRGLVHEWQLSPWRGGAEQEYRSWWHWKVSEANSEIYNILWWLKKGLSLNPRRIELGMVNMKRCLATNENLLYSSGNSRQCCVVT